VKRFATVGAAILGAILFAYWVRAIGVGQIREALGRIGWGFFAIVLLGGAREAIRALAWTRTVTAPAALPFLDAFAARLAGEAINTLVPMGVIVGEPAKADHVSHRLAFGTAFRALIVEFAFYTASLPLLFMFATLVFVPAAAGFILPVVAVGAIVAAHVPLPGRVRTLVDPLIEFGRVHGHRVWSIGAFEISYHALAIVEVYVTLALVAPGRASWASALVLETVNRGVTIVFKMLPMRIGVDEAGAALVAARFDLSSTTGVTVALVRKLRLLVWNGIGLLILLARSGRTSARVPAVGAVRG
jgi:glycosyltransferase 2 family protein